MFTKDSTKNDYSKLIKNYIRNKCPTQPDYISPIKMALHKSGYDNYELFVDANEKLILLDSDKDMTSGLVIKDNEIVDFRNSTDWEAVSVDVCARYNILKHISNGEDLRNVREIFRKKRTWLIHYEKTEDGGFNAHTHGLDRCSIRKPPFVGEYNTVDLYRPCKIVYLYNFHWDIRWQ